MHYVIGDVHGCLYAVKELMNKIEAQDEDARFLFVGDFVDRGPQVVETIRWMMDHITKDGKYQMVLGNHEMMVMQWYEEEFLPFIHGEKKALQDTRYDFSSVMKEHGMLTEEALAPIMDFFYNQPLVLDKTIMMESGYEVRFLIVHGWISEELVERLDCGEDISDEWKYLVWDRSHMYAEEDLREYIIVHGHTPTNDPEYYKEGTWPGCICYRLSGINVDAGFVYKDEQPDWPYNQAAICLETLEEFYSLPSVKPKKYAKNGKISDNYRRSIYKRYGIKARSKGKK